MNLEIVLPPYPGISLEHVYLVQSLPDAERALAVLEVADVLGFDTESKPVFFKGQQSTGPHLIQLATDQEVFLFPVVAAGHSTVAIKAVLESPQILKVGFGLGDDHKRLQAKLGITPRHVLDLSRALREKGQGDLGAKSAVAMHFGMRLQKSKKVSTSNWAAALLNERQIKYAADDAHVALLVYRKWQAGGTRFAG
ncbi:3'-5' exonuclease [Iodobacter ciconiae]|uniref:3'-5' exonuclease domain-containing protein 2 n=1 Tax=Iodobacter ciconiae TaxID=2496266 RepID=A0A3S8ZNX9_9NEIS|nr:3'-5' exonuclease [Iodobacter ciconiae]AZN35099.1 3'-5' exonuclease domain-containing protein 2 [Iodobacter ciconiae]